MSTFLRTASLLMAVVAFIGAAGPAMALERRGNANVNRNSNRSFNANNFHKDVTVQRNTNVNVNTNRNVAVVGRPCCARYDSGPGWGAVAAGVAVGAVVGAAAASAPPPPPPYYSPGYVYVPPY